MALESAPAAPAGERLSGPGSPPLKSAAERLASFDVNAFPVPTGREEEWRFTPRPPDEAAARGRRERRPPEVDDRPARRRRGRRGAGRRPAAQARAGAVRPHSALAYANSGGAIALRVAANTELDRPAVVELRGTSVDDVVWGHVVVEVGANATATVVIDHTGSATYGAMLSVIVGDGARLTLVNLQDWDDDAVHVEHQAASVGRDATFTSAVVTLGGDLVRLTPTVRFTGPGASAELLGLYFADAGQHLEHRLFIDHDQPNCRSRVTYKGALQGARAHSVWIGDVLIRAAATGTDTYELNRNLILTDGARADSVPEPRDRDRRDRRRRARERDRPLRRRAAVLPAVARHPGGRGPAARRAWLLRRHRQPDRRPGGPRPPACRGGA